MLSLIHLRENLQALNMPTDFSKTVQIWSLYANAADVGFLNVFHILLMAAGNKEHNPPRVG